MAESSEYISDWFTWIPCIFRNEEAEPSIRQHVEFMREHRNPHDKFAVAGGVLLPV